MELPTIVAVLELSYHVLMLRLDKVSLKFIRAKCGASALFKQLSDSIRRISYCKSATLSDTLNVLEDNQTHETHFSLILKYKTTCRYNAPSCGCIALWSVCYVSYICVGFLPNRTVIEVFGMFFFYWNWNKIHIFYLVYIWAVFFNRLFFLLQHQQSTDNTKGC